MSLTRRAQAEDEAKFALRHAARMSVCLLPNSAVTAASCTTVSSSLNASARPMIFTTRAGSDGMNGRIKTRELSG